MLPLIIVLALATISGRPSNESLRNEAIKNNKAAEVCLRTREEVSRLQTKRQNLLNVFVSNSLAFDAEKTTDVALKAEIKQLKAEQAKWAAIEAKDCADF